MRTMLRPTSFIPPPPSRATELDIEAFFNKYRSLLSPEEFGRFSDLVSKTRPSWGRRCFVSSSTGKLSYEYGSIARMDIRRSRAADLSKMEIIFVEDVDVRLLVALDTAYHLDPQFLLAYKGAGDKHSPDFETTSGPADMAGKWYITEISMLLEDPWHLEDSNNPSKIYTRVEPWFTNLFRRRHATGTDFVSPWWKEPVRTEVNFSHTKVSSKIACYCLTDKLRESE